MSESKQTGQGEPAAALKSSDVRGGGYNAPHATTDGRRVMREDDDGDPYSSPARSARQARTLSESLRDCLRKAGIILDEPTNGARQRCGPAEPPPPPDRAEIRAILVGRGAPSEQLDWLTRSCPTLEDAHAYKPPGWSKDR